MSHILHVTCHKCYMSQISSCKQFPNDPVCCIFLESLCKIQFNGQNKNVSCHMCCKSHVTHFTFNNINLQTTTTQSKPNTMDRDRKPSFTAPSPGLSPAPKGGRTNPPSPPPPSPSLAAAASTRFTQSTLLSFVSRTRGPGNST